MAEKQYNDDALKTKKIQKEEYSDNGSSEKPTEYGKISAKSKKVGKVAGIIITIVGAGLVLGSILQYSFVYKPTAVIDKFQLEAERTSIKYDVVVKDMDTEYLTLKLYNQFVTRTEQIILGENIGYFEDLKPGFTYTISIIEKDVLVKKQTITTLRG